MPSELGKIFAKSFRDAKKKADGEPPEQQDIDIIDIPPDAEVERKKEFSRIKKLLGYAPKV